MYPTKKRWREAILWKVNIIKSGHKVNILKGIFKYLKKWSNKLRFEIKNMNIFDVSLFWLNSEYMNMFITSIQPVLSKSDFKDLYLFL